MGNSIPTTRKPTGNEQSITDKSFTAKPKRKRRTKSVDFLKEDVGIQIRMQSQKMWGAQIYTGKLRRYKDIGHGEYELTIVCKGELRLEDLIQ